ncbi:unnamed protein product [Moneuplotes crassus]|uniref:RING-type E3 ubiquitin transferase n=1 Tax=Euplotes crassus TaxID=5936 RepID=A0AAD1XTS0_EUPCR|nr:unnamed protein product [Moneuplotes crassus]
MLVYTIGLVIIQNFNTNESPCIRRNLKFVVVFLCYLVIFKIPLNLLRILDLVSFKEECGLNLIFRLISKVFLTGWFVYFFIKYFDLGEDDSIENCYSMYPFMFYGVYVYIQAITLIFVVLAFLVLFCIFARTPNRLNANARNGNQLLNRITRSVLGTRIDHNRLKCLICLEEFQQEDGIVTVKCSHQHIFHQNCALEWILRKNQCPLCKEDVLFNNLQCTQHEE